MRKITDLFGKPVLSLYESVSQGIVKDILFDKIFKKAKYLVLFEDNEFQEEKILRISDIYNNGDNAIIIRNNTYLNTNCIITDEIENPINNQCYTTMGKFLGQVSDVFLDEKYNITSLLLNTEEIIDINNIVNAGKDTVFIQDESNIVRLCNFKSKKIYNSNDNKNIKVEILTKSIQNDTIPNNDLAINNEELSVMQSDKSDPTPLVNQNNELSVSQNDNNEIVNVTDEQKITNKQTAKKKIILNENCLPTFQTTKNNFLIGRKVNQNIYSFAHEIIIRKNTRISEKTILIAKSHSKLKELSLYSS